MIRPWGVGEMFRRLALILSVVAIGLLLDGCTKCGAIWDDWTQSPKSCKAEVLQIGSILGLTPV